MLTLGAWHREYQIRHFTLQVQIPLHLCLQDFSMTAAVISGLAYSNA